jgi:hypothetical protein
VNVIGMHLLRIAGQRARIAGTSTVWFADTALEMHSVGVATTVAAAVGGFLFGTLFLRLGLMFGNTGLRPGSWRASLCGGILAGVWIAILLHV